MSSAPVFRSDARVGDLGESDFASGLESLPDERDSEDGPDTITQAHPTLSHIGRYALKAQLGEGGLGQVYEAWDPLLSRPVALKTLQLDLPPATRSALDGLILAEARTAASLSHPHIVTVFDAGLSPQGVYIAMERLHGRDLRQALAAGWLPSPRSAALLVRRVADALDYAHGRGVVHCDIKPANIFLVGRCRPMVLDFGIARVAHRPAGAVPDGLVAGSPHYLAPEQLQGGAVDGRADIHALGAVLYELLTGRRAFPAARVSPDGRPLAGVEPPPAHALRAAVPPALSEIAARAMAADPAQRFPSADTMADALRRWAAEQATARAADPARSGRRRPPERPAPAPRGSRLRGGRMTIAALAAALTAGLAAALAATWWLARTGA